MRKILIVFVGVLILGMMLPVIGKSQVLIGGEKAWVKTKIAVVSGDQVNVQVTGTLTLDPNVTCTADGLKIVSGPEHVALKGANRGALIGKVGKKGVPFLVGSNGKITIGTSGVMFFRVNDDVPKNNAGAYSLIITVNGQVK